MNGTAAVKVNISEYVQFDFRFDPNLVAHSEKISVRRGLVYKFANDRVGQSKLRKVTLYPVSRAGKSGSEVFYLDLYQEEASFPERLIAKFQSRELTEREAHSARLAKIASLCGSDAYKCIDEEADLGLIVYSLAQASDHIEFRGFFLDLQNNDEACANALKSIFKSVGRKHNSEAKIQPLIDDFNWYVDRKTKPLERIDALAIVAPVNLGIGTLAVSIRETYERIKCTLNVDVHPYLVHGDLHARNLMLSRANPSNTELIDFGWVHSGHPAKDLVLMETTLKYMLLPELLPIAKGTATDRLHIDAESIQKFELFLCQHKLCLPSVADMLKEVFPEGLPPHQSRAMARVYRCLIEVRSAAGEVLSDYCQKHSPSSLSPEKHYFASFFLVTLGLLGFSEIDQIWAMIGLQTTGSVI